VLLIKIRNWNENVFFSKVQIFFKRYFTIYVILDFTPYDKHVSFQFLIFKHDKLIYILVLHSLIKVYLQLLVINEFLFIHPKPQCLHIVYTIITAIPTCLLVWKSSNRRVIILYHGYANSNTFL
jgi:hypothetical protein